MNAPSPSISASTSDTAATKDAEAIAGNRAVVIGAGFGGIAAALRLRAKGYDVTLLERGKRLGGRAQVFERGGYRHDAGPTVITAPFLFEELFALFGAQMEDYLTLVPLGPWYRYWFPDGDTFDYGGTVEDTEREIARFSEADVEGYRKLVAHSEQLFDAGFTRLADQPFHKFSTMFKEGTTLVKLRAHDTVWSMICRYLKHPKLRQAFSIQPLLVGGSPFDTTSIYGLIHYLERKWGVFFAMGGTGAIVGALETLAREQGVEIRLESTVTTIKTHGRTATGVVLESGEVLSADVVVSNADPLHLYQSMVPKKQQALTTRLKTRFSRKSMGLYVLYFGSTKQFPDVAHHTIWMGKRYKELLDDIFHRGILADDFSLYVHRPTATDPSFAPEGCDSFYVLAPVPNLDANLDWEIEGPKLRDRIVEALDKSMLPGIAEHMVEDFFMTPVDFKEDYLSASGTGFSIAPYFTQSAWFRFHNRSESLDNLYLTGAGTHPGAGMPGVLCSAKVVDGMIPPVAR
jgi:phytoene desaturase